MNKNSNSFEIIFDSKSENESFARVVVAAFCTRLDPTLEEISDIKTAVSEAVTNCIVHGYEGREGKISLKCELNDNELTIEVHDDGVETGYIESLKEFALMVHTRDLLLDSRTTMEMRERIEKMLCNHYGIHYSEELESYV